MLSSPHSRNRNSLLKVSVKAIKQFFVLHLVKILSFSFSTSRAVLILQNKIVSSYSSAIINNKIVNQVAIEVLKITNERRFALLHFVKKAQIRFEFGLYQSYVGFSKKNAIARLRYKSSRRKS